MISRLALLTYRVTDRALDLARGWETWRQVPVTELEVSGISRIQGKKYQATPYLVLRRVFAELTSEDRMGSFADLGCGKGRVLDFALARGFRRAIGLEHSGILARRAEENLTGRGWGSERFVILNGDAGAWEIPEEVNVVFLFNPFGRAVLQNILTGLEFRRERKWIYVNPMHLDALVSSGLELETWRGDLNENYAYAILHG